MKSLIYISIIAVLGSICIPAFGQDTSAVESFEILSIGGIISHLDEPIESINVELWEGNKVVTEELTKKNGKYKFTLYSEKIYTIEISKKGYYAKRVSINTKLSGVDGDFQKFPFDIGMTLKGEKDFDEYLKDYPVALIEFHKKRKEFVFDKEYTRTYMSEISPSKY
ncbi:MAG: hypothetical protein HN542_06405 [Flavobacteriales bacterium]|jgi:hypothetical protein|nr:hypothetical protein [Flavobacteriales bacterium]NCG30838.1 hypothetical protein [Bacteroidota bacterium]MBT3962635.1 hypothetical protein [Flavobacteriales bacterium]MBT4705243.1 hypothetical protein [Flavobacteriales bacterium]MBT4931312.1 hypothetical protein [Flavobacteriales bacterium]